MKALNFFKNYGKSLVLGLGLLGGVALSNDASAQTQPKQDKDKKPAKEAPKPKLMELDGTWKFQDSSRKVLTDKKGLPYKAPAGIPGVPAGTIGTIDSLHTRDANKFKKDAPKQKPQAPKLVLKDTTVAKQIPNTAGMEKFLADEKKKRDAATPEENAKGWTPEAKAAYNKRKNAVPKTITVLETIKVAAPDTIPSPALQNLPDSIYQEKLDTIKTREVYKIEVAKPDTVYRQPWRVMAGLIERNTMGKKRDVNAPADREFTEVFPVAGHEKAKGKFVEVSKDFGQIFRGYARAEWYENDTLTKLIAKDNMDATLVNTKAMSADFDNNYQFGVDVAPPIQFDGKKVTVGSKNNLEQKLKQKNGFNLIVQPSLGLNYRVAMNQSPKLVYIEQDRYDPNPVRLSMIQGQNLKTNSTSLSVRGGINGFLEYGTAITRTKYQEDKDGKRTPKKVIVGEIAGFVNAGFMVNKTIAGGNPVLHQTATGEAYGAPKNFYTKQVAVGIKLSF